MNKEQIEILSPAGSEEAFYAAIHNGADAVYLGGMKFGARAYANNFSISKLSELIRYAHRYQVKVYYALNTLIKDIEFKELEEVLHDLSSLMIDALIIQDFGVYAYLRKNYPNFILHGSTQMNLHNALDADYAKHLGFDRIVLARECSLAGIDDIAKKVAIELEVFVHGALCYSYSGQCLMSSFYGGRSGNRGKCAQPCRLAYESEGQNGHLISLKDQMTLELLPKLIPLGVHSYKIEGRMKGESYVAYSTYLYSKYRNLALELIDEGREDEYHIDPNEIQQMNQLYNRGHYNRGYYEEHNQREMISRSVSKHQGIEIGRIRFSKGVFQLVVKKDLQLHKGDLLEIRLPNGDTKELQSMDPEKLINGTRDLYDHDGKRIDSRILQKGSDLVVFRLRDMSLLDYIMKMKKRRLPVNITLLAQVDQELQLTLESCHTKVNVQGDIVSAALNKALDQDSFMKQLSKLQDTPFEINRATINISGAVFVRLSAINELRRRGIEALEEALSDQYLCKLNQKKEEASRQFIPSYLGSESNTTEKSSLQFSSKFNVILRTEEQLFAMIECEMPDVSRICIDLNNLTMKEINSMIALARKHYGCEIYLVLPLVLLYEYEKALDELLQNIKEEYDGFLIRSIGQIKLAKQQNKRFALDYNMNVFNSWARDFWISQGATGICGSLELNQAAFRLLAKGHEDHIEQYVYGKAALMHSSSCILKTTKGCRYKVGGNLLKLEDRKKEALTVQTNCRFCYNSIYNSKATYLLDVMDEIPSLKRIEFTDEDASTIKAIFSKANPYSFADKNYTRGHYKRGVD